MYNSITSSIISDILIRFKAVDELNTIDICNSPNNFCGLILGDAEHLDKFALRANLFSLWACSFCVLILNG